MVLYNGGDPLADMQVGDDMSRRRSYFDDVWSPETRHRLGLPLFVRLEIPITHKADMANHWVDMLRGLANKLEAEGKNLGNSEHAAALMMKTHVDHANRQMKMRANLLKTGRRRQSNEVD